MADTFGGIPVVVDERVPPGTFLIGPPGTLPGGPGWTAVPVDHVEVAPFDWDDVELDPGLDVAGWIKAELAKGLALELDKQLLGGGPPPELKGILDSPKTDLERLHAEQLAAHHAEQQAGA